MANNQSKPIRFSYQRQQWSVPDSFIYYICKNPSSAEVYQKLINTCKYFYFKNPITVASDFHVGIISEKWQVSSYIHGKAMDFNNDSIKYWITESFDTSSLFAKTSLIFLSSVISRFYQVNVRKLKLFIQDISFKEFLFLSGSAEDVDLYRSTIKDDDGAIVPVENLLASLSKVKCFKFQHRDYASSCITSETVKELLELPRFSKLKEFELMEIPDTFDIGTLFDDHIQYNRHTKFFFCFRETISLEYQNILHKISDKILLNGAEVYRCPWIHFEQQDREKFLKISDLYYRYLNFYYY